MQLASIYFHSERRQLPDKRSSGIYVDETCGSKLRPRTSIERDTARASRSLDQPISAPEISPGSNLFEFPKRYLIHPGPLY